MNEIIVFLFTFCEVFTNFAKLAKVDKNEQMKIEWPKLSKLFVNVRKCASKASKTFQAVSKESQRAKNAQINIPGVQ